MHSLSEYSWRTCYHMWSKLTFKEKGGEKCHVYSTERTRNVTLGATNLTFNGGLWVISEKKIFITSNWTGSRVFRLCVNEN